MAIKKKKIHSFLQALCKKYGEVTRPEFVPPPSSADAAAAMTVSRKNSEIIAGAVLGLHGTPHQGADAARKLMAICVDWNEVRVCSAPFLVKALGKDPKGPARIALLQRFLEVFFLRQRNLMLDYLVNLRVTERRQFISNLEIFTRDELSALLLTCFGHSNFPPVEALHGFAKENGLISTKTTVLQMAKQFEGAVEEEELLPLYAHLFAAVDEAAEKAAKVKKTSKKRVKK